MFFSSSVACVRVVDVVFNSVFVVARFIYVHEKSKLFGLKRNPLDSPSTLLHVSIEPLISTIPYYAATVELLSF